MQSTEAKSQDINQQRKACLEKGLSSIKSYHNLFFSPQICQSTVKNIAK